MASTVQDMSTTCGSCQATKRVSACSLQLRSAKDDRFCKVKFGEEAGASLLLNEHRLKSVPTSTASSTTDTV